MRASRLSLLPGDVLLIASDGIGSVEGHRGDYFEDRRLRRTLTSLVGCGGDDVVERLAAEAVTFGHGRRPPDDVNLIAVWRPGAPAGAPGERAAVPVGPRVI